MNGVLLWKEYRQQRTLWLAIALLAILLAVVLNQTLDQGRARNFSPHDRLPSSVNMLLFCLMVAHGTVTGAMLLAGEKEDGTLVFLDRLTGIRGPVWVRKFVAGALFTLAQCLVLAALSLGLGSGSWSEVLFVPLLGLDALAWGLLGGALFRTVLPATLFGILAMAGAWCFFSLPANGAALIVGVAGTGSLAGYISWRKFCGDDVQRLPAETRRRRLLTVPATWRVVGWLAYRQGRWILISAAAGALLLGLFVNRAPLILWPCGTLLLGLVCGLAVFAPDQQEGNLFLGAQRFPPGRIWALKSLFWATALVGLTVLFWYTATALACYLAVMLPVNLTFDSFDHPSEAVSHVGEVEYWLNRWLDQLYHWPFIQSPALLLGLWPVYGYCLGQFFGQVVRRPIIALILSLCIAPVVAAFWMPSLLIGGVALWQASVIPLLLLLTTRLALWPWFSGRLLTLRPLLGITASSLLVVLCLAGFLALRAFEVPDLGEPFDVDEFIATLPTVEHQAAADRPFLSAAAVGLLATPQGQGPLLAIAGLSADTLDPGAMLRRAALSLRNQIKKVESELGPPPELIAPAAQQPMAPGAIAAGVPGADSASDYGSRYNHVLEHGWPKNDPVLDRWLDEIFEGEWASDAQTASRLPLGMLFDPRQFAFDRSFWNIGLTVREVSSYFVARALQRQAHGDARGSLNHLETALALARQVKNFAPVRVYQMGRSMDSAALSGFRLWLRKTGPDKELLRAALAVLRRHEAAEPDVANAIKAQYVADRDRVFEVILPSYRGDRPIYKAFRVSWEKERDRRVFKAMYAGNFRQLREPVVPRDRAPSTRDRETQLVLGLAEDAGLPPRDGPGSSISARKWGEFILQSRMFDPVGLGGARSSNMHVQRELHATQLVIAVAAYQADHSRLPASLDDLVPAYFVELPIDSSTGRPFLYHISKGDEFAAGSEIPRATPGQAVIQSEDGRIFFPVPTWKE